MNQEIDYHSKYLKYKKKYLNLKSELDGGENEVSWQNEPKFDPVYNSKKPELKDMNCQNSEIKIFLQTYGTKDLKWCMDKKSVELKDLKNSLIVDDNYYHKTFYPYILKKMFPESSHGTKLYGTTEINYLELTKISYTKPKVERYEHKEKFIRLEISYLKKSERIELQWLDGSLFPFDPTKHLKFGFFGKIKEGKIGDHDIDLEKFVKEHKQFLNDFQIKLNEVYKIWVQVLQRQKDEDITAFLVKLKEMWNRTHRFFVSIKK